MTRTRTAILCLGLIVLGGILFLPGLRWGLPSREVDPFLFGNHPVWSGREILQQIGDSPGENARAADVSSRPLDHLNRAIVVNETDSDRARIIRRYRLMSYQPDEFTTFAALSQMKPARGDLDPRMYKYGGLWIYPIGATLKLASIAGLVQLRPDAAWYLDHPEAFGRFYIVARLYSAAWGLVAILAVFLLIRRITGNVPAAVCGAVCFILMPVVVTAAHEAKPHLAGTALMLLAVLAAAKYAEEGRRWWAIAAAILCGAAIGMVPSALPVLLVLPVMVMFQTRLGTKMDGVPIDRETRWIWLLARGLIAAAVYCLTNPYVPINLFRDRALLRSNFGNSSAFYHADWTGGGLPGAVMGIGWGMGLVLGAVGIIGAIALLVRAIQNPSTDAAEIRRRITGMILAAATLPVGIAFILFAAGQPADYARFALPFDAFLAIEGTVAVATFIRPSALRCFVFAALITTTAIPAVSYVKGFMRDASGPTTRMIAAQYLRGQLAAGARTLATREEPAPWSLPPVNLFRWQLILPPRTLPPDAPLPGADLTIGPQDSPSLRGPAWLTATPISWASKRFGIHRPGAVLAR